jgi:hypothetical protein
MQGTRSQQSEQVFQPIIPRTWDDAEISTLELPLADPKGSPVHVSADYYYRIPVRPIYKQYPIYAPGKEPAGYLDWLKQQEPEVIFDAKKLKTKADWIRAGEIVFDSPDVFSSDYEYVRNPQWYQKTGTPLTKEGVMPFYSYVIRTKGKIEIGRRACATCHIRVMPDGTTLKGAQGNFPFDRDWAYTLRTRLKVDEARSVERLLFAMPWLQPDPSERLQKMSLEEIVTAHEAIPPAVIARHRTNVFSPAQVPDLIGVKDRHYLDRTGLQQQRSIVDLMRYAALNQGADDLANYAGFIPAGGAKFDKLPDAQLQSRYSDEQLYALALYVYSLQPPPNPNKFEGQAVRGKQVFENEGCPTCHTPPLYTSNKLTRAEGFRPSAQDLKKYDIFPLSVGTDPALALQTRRGTGYYKVPSLKGLWYRGMFAHDGSCAELEDWFDPRRHRRDYVPTGFKGYGVQTRAVPGHPFGLQLSNADRAALVAFLRTL